MPASFFPILPEQVVSHLSTDQVYALAYIGHLYMEKLMMIWLMWKLDSLFTRDGSL